MVWRVTGVKGGVDIDRRAGEQLWMDGEAVRGG